VERAGRKTVGLAYDGSNPSPATTCGNAPLAADSRLRGAFLRGLSVGHHVSLWTMVLRCPRTHSGPVRRRSATSGACLHGWAEPSAFHGPPRTGGWGRFTPTVRWPCRPASAGARSHGFAPTIGAVAHSQAYSQTYDSLIQDVQNLITLHPSAEGTRGRPAGDTGPRLRSAVVLVHTAWENYVERVAVEGLDFVLG
jgi:hypothetical protein